MPTLSQFEYLLSRPVSLFPLDTVPRLLGQLAYSMLDNPARGSPHGDNFNTLVDKFRGHSIDREVSHPGSAGYEGRMEGHSGLLRS